MAIAQTPTEKHLKYFKDVVKSLSHRRGSKNSVRSAKFEMQADLVDVSEVGRATRRKMSMGQSISFTAYVVDGRAEAKALRREKHNARRRKNPIKYCSYCGRRMTSQVEQECYKCRRGETEYNDYVR